MERVGVVVVGGGAVGCAVAYELACAGMSDVFLLERQPSVGEVQSGRNSGVIHAGIYYTTGSLKAALCVEGNQAMFEFCRAHGVAVDRVGKLVVAATDDELLALEVVFRQAQANGVQGVRMLTRSEVNAYEPNVDVEAAMHVPTTGIVDAASYVGALAAQAQAAGAQVLTSFDVTGITPRDSVFEVTGIHGWQEEVFETEVLVNAAGLDCDSVARMVNPAVAIEVAPLRGEYYRFNRRSRPAVWLNGLNIYPVPEPLDLPGERITVVGVHLTPTFAMSRDGTIDVGDVVTVGPQFVPVEERDDYESGRKPAEHFLQRARRFFPGLEFADLALDFSGIMVHLKGTREWTIARDDRYPNCVQLLGIDSPGLTSSLAIARRVRSLLLGS
jgi:L-2-hydroxyglutarate oxidase LhgO